MEVTFRHVLRNTTAAQVREQLERFIGVMERLVDSHRAEAGYAKLPLRVY
jgi:hypothetical protein